MPKNLFLSYSTPDRDIAELILSAIESEGSTGWMAPRDVPPGVSYPKAIVGAIRDCDGVVLVLSQSSNESPHVLREVERASSESKPLFVVRIEPVVLSDDLAYFTSLNQWVEASREQIQRDAKTALTAILAAVESPRSTEAAPATRGTPASLLLDATSQHAALAIMSRDGRLFQLDGRHGLGESPFESGDLIAPGDLGAVALASDGSVIATCTPGGEVGLWMLGSEDAMPGPLLAEALPAAGPFRLLSVDRPLGQAIRVVASSGLSVYSLMQQADGAWSAMKLVEGDEPTVSGAVVNDDVLLVRAGGGTLWASNRSKRPFALPVIRGIDAALGADGRYHLVGWGTGPDGSALVEAVVEADGGWERIYRGPGIRAGVVRVVRDVVRQAPGASVTSIAVQTEECAVAIRQVP